jgi:hypothetical protein
MAAIEAAIIRHATPLPTHEQRLSNQTWQGPSVLFTTRGQVFESIRANSLCVKCRSRVSCNRAVEDRMPELALCFAGGYGVREQMSRKRHRRAREVAGY